MHRHVTYRIWPLQLSSFDATPYPQRNFSIGFYRFTCSAASRFYTSATCPPNYYSWGTGSCRGLNGPGAPGGRGRLRGLLFNSSSTIYRLLHFCWPLLYNVVLEVLHFCCPYSSHSAGKVLLRCCPYSIMSCFTIAIYLSIYNCA